MAPMTLGDVLLIGIVFILCTLGAFYAGRWSK